MSSILRRIGAFTTNPEGGNPAGVWVGDELPPVDEMQRVAAEIGYSETAFIAPTTGAERDVRYYSPEGEVPFCGHATIASGALLAELSGDGDYTLNTIVGPVSVSSTAGDGTFSAALTSVEPATKAASPEIVEEALAALSWNASELDDSIPVALAYAGAWHLVIAVSTRARLADLAYDFDRLKTLMLANELTTLQLIWRESTDVFHARNPFPVGGVIEDPATGAAAAALGGYLRSIVAVNTPATLTIHQGDDMGRPSVLTVNIPSTGGITVSGAAVALT